MQNNEYSQIPFSECQVMTDDDEQNIYIYHNGSEVLSDYNHTGFYLETAIALFMVIKDQHQSWICRTYGNYETASGKTSITT